MTLGNLLSLDQIIPEMQATERWSAIVELVDLLVSQGRIRPEDRDVVLGALRAREETMSTGIGFGIAIPHASSDRVDQVVAAFGRSSKGIEFDSLDNLPVQLHRPLCRAEGSIPDPSAHARRDREVPATTVPCEIAWPLRRLLQEILSIFESTTK